MNRLLGIGLAIVVAGIVLGLGIVAWSWADSAANEWEGSAVVASGDASVFTFRQSDAGAEAVFRFTVESGPRVDVYVLQDADCARYLAQEPIPPSPNSYRYENIAEVDESPYPSMGLWHVVIDNTDYGVARPGGAAAYVRYLVLGGGASFSLFFGGIGISALTAIVGSAVMIVAHANPGSTSGLTGDGGRARP